MRKIIYRHLPEERDSEERSKRIAGLLATAIQRFLEDPSNLAEKTVDFQPNLSVTRHEETLREEH